MLPFFYLGSVQVFSYPLILGVVWALAFNYSKYLIGIRKLIIPHFNLFYILAFLSAWIGAKSLFLLTLDTKLIDRAIDSSNFWLGGGFVFYGGLIFGVFFILIFSLIFKLKLKTFEFTIPVISISHGLGRIACFLAGCCYGNSCKLPWAIYQHGQYRHPVQLYEAGSLILFSYFSLKRYKQNKSIIVEYIVFYSALRFILEFFRGDGIRGVYAFGISTSQVISIILITCCVALVLFNKISKNKNKTV